MIKCCTKKAFGQKAAASQDLKDRIAKGCFDLYLPFWTGQGIPFAKCPLKPCMEERIVSYRMYGEVGFICKD
jgi:hypothetical protein